MWPDGRHQLPPHRGRDAVGGDQKIGGNFTAVVETRQGALLVLLDRYQRAAVAVDSACPQTQALPDAIPRCQHLQTCDLADPIAVPRQHNAASDGDAELATLLGRESERFVQFVVGSDARAARAKFLAGALVDRYVTADLAKEQPREQTAARPADDDGALSLSSGRVHHDRAWLGGGESGQPLHERKRECSTLAVSRRDAAIQGPWAPGDSWIAASAFGLLAMTA